MIERSTNTSEGRNDITEASGYQPPSKKLDCKLFRGDSLEAIKCKVITHKSQIARSRRSARKREAATDVLTQASEYDDSTLTAHSRPHFSPHAREYPESEIPMEELEELLMASRDKGQRRTVDVQIYPGDCEWTRRYKKSIMRSRLSRQRPVNCSEEDLDVPATGSATSGTALNALMSETSRPSALNIDDSLSEQLTAFMADSRTEAVHAPTQYQRSINTTQSSSAVDHTPSQEAVKRTMGRPRKDVTIYPTDNKATIARKKRLIYLREWNAQRTKDKVSRTHLADSKSDIACAANPVILSRSDTIVAPYAPPAHRYISQLGSVQGSEADLQEEPKPTSTPPSGGLFASSEESSTLYSDFLLAEWESADANSSLLSLGDDFRVAPELDFWDDTEAVSPTDSQW